MWGTPARRACGLRRRDLPPTRREPSWPLRPPGRAADVASLLAETAARPPHTVRPHVCQVEGVTTMAYPGDPLPERLFLNGTLVGLTRQEADALDTALRATSPSCLREREAA